MWNVLLGAAGAGAESYGRDTMQEEERKRAAAQRLQEIAENNAARLAQQTADDGRTAEARAASQAAGSNSIRALFPDAKMPDGEFDPALMLRGLHDQRSEALSRDRMTASESRALAAEEARELRQQKALEASERNQNRRIDAAAANRTPPDTPEERRRKYAATRMPQLTKPTYNPTTRLTNAITADSAGVLIGQEWDALEGKPRGAPAPRPFMGPQRPEGGPPAAPGKVMDATMRAEAARDPAAAQWYRDNGWK